MCFKYLARFLEADDDIDASEYTTSRYFQNAVDRVVMCPSPC